MALGSGTPPPEAGRGGGEGVRTRDHLANARTFLAWTRAALALVTVGYVIDKFDLIVHLPQHRSIAIGQAGNRTVALLVVTIGIGLTIGAFLRFFVARRMIDAAVFRPRPLLDLPLIVAAAVGGLLILGYLAMVRG